MKLPKTPLQYYEFAMVARFILIVAALIAIFFISLLNGYVDLVEPSLGMELEKIEYFESQPKSDVELNLSDWTSEPKETKED